eukprot:8164-Heterococcus_DN1.PRE.22
MGIDIKGSDHTCDYATLTHAITTGNSFVRNPGRLIVSLYIHTYTRACGCDYNQNCDTMTTSSEKPLLSLQSLYSTLIL